jgi:hypothetical protein
MMQFHPGARVSFDSPNGERLSGTVMKFNRKTVTMVTDNGHAGIFRRTYFHRSKTYRRGRWWTSGHKKRSSSAANSPTPAGSDLTPAHALNARLFLDRWGLWISYDRFASHTRGRSRMR